MLKKCVLSTRALTVFYRSTIDSIMSGCLTAWYSNSTAADSKAFQRVIRAAESTIGCTLSAHQDIYNTRCRRKAKKIINDPSHPSHALFSPLQSHRCRQYRSIMAKTERLANSFYHQTIRLLNSHH
jgi:hypothetical protein